MNVIEAKNLVKKYKNTLAVAGVSFTVETGEILGVLGPNGVGKTTLLSLVSTLFKPDQGEIYFKGENIVQKPKAIRPYLGFVPQDIALYETLRVKDNLYFWGGIYGVKHSEIKNRMCEVLEIVGLNLQMNHSVGNLSGGMKRRLNIAAALMHKPQILIMDEPTVGIDTESREYITSALKNLKREGMSVIYTSHYIDEAEFLCDKIMVMNKGKASVWGTIDELRNMVGLKDKIRIRVNPDINEEKLKKIPFMVQNNAQCIDGVLEIPADQGKTEIIEVLKSLEASAIKLDEVYIEKPGLERIYLELLKKEA